MLRILLISLALTSGCSCGSSGSSPDAAMPADAGAADSEAVFVDASPRDASLPCEGTVALLRTDTSALPPAYFRSQVRAARAGDGLVVGWFNDDGTGEGEWLLARVRDPDAPRAELVDPLPLPGLLGLYNSPSDRVRVLMTESPGQRSVGARGGWADLQPDASFGALHRFEPPAGLSVGGGRPCMGADAAAFHTCSAGGIIGATLMRMDATTATFLEPAFAPLFGLCTGMPTRYAYGVEGCVASGAEGVTSVLVIGSDALQPPGVLEWRPDGSLLHAEPLRLGSETDGDIAGVAGIDDLGPIYFILSGSSEPRISAYRTVGNDVAMLGSGALDQFPYLIRTILGAVRIMDGRWLVAYAQTGVLSVITFSDIDGFGVPIIVAMGGFSGGSHAVHIGTNVYLVLDGLWILRVCGGA